jgi:predicted neutral ceramidase superfamily lipid hydrolase
MKRPMVFYAAVAVPVLQTAFIAFAILNERRELFAWMVIAVLAVVFFAPVILLWKFPRWGKWVAVLFFTVAFLATLRGFLQLPEHSWLSLVRASVWSALLIWLAWSLAFGKQIRRFVDRKSNKQMPNQPLEPTAASGSGSS